MLATDVSGALHDVEMLLVVYSHFSLSLRSEFIKEIRLLSVLEDPNISRVLGMCSGQEPYFVAMEYLEHGDLNQFLRCHLPEGSASSLPPGTRTLSLGTLIHMASQVASGMRYLESLNFVHRDLATRYANI